MFTLYLKALAIVFLTLASLGWILPFLFSAPSNEAVIGGLIYLAVVFPYALYQLSLSLIKDVRK
jgi:hypothetical protein